MDCVSLSAEIGDARNQSESVTESLMSCASGFSNIQTLKVIESKLFLTLLARYGYVHTFYHTRLDLEPLLALYVLVLIKIRGNTPCQVRLRLPKCEYPVPRPAV